MDGLAVLVQEVLHQDPFTGHLFVFRGRKANLIKIVFWDGTGLSPVHQEAGIWRLRLAGQYRAGTDAFTHLGATLAPP